MACPDAPVTPVANIIGPTNGGASVNDDRRCNNQQWICEKRALHQDYHLRAQGAGDKMVKVAIIKGPVDVHT